MIARAEEEFDEDPATLREVRRFLAATLSVWDLDDVAEIAVLLTNELVTNAVLHARSAFRVVATYEPPDLMVEVWDGSPQLPRRRSSHALAEGGRGLRLLEMLATRWGVRREGPCKVVWFCLSAGP